MNKDDSFIRRSFTRRWTSQVGGRTSPVLHLVSWWDLENPVKVFGRAGPGEEHFDKRLQKISSPVNAYAAPRASAPYAPTSSRNFRQA